MLVSGPETGPPSAADDGEGGRINTLRIREERPAAGVLIDGRRTAMNYITLFLAFAALGTAGNALQQVKTLRAEIESLRKQTDPGGMRADDGRNWQAN